MVVELSDEEQIAEAYSLIRQIKEATDRLAEIIRSDKGVPDEAQVLDPDPVQP